MENQLNFSHFSFVSGGNVLGKEESGWGRNSIVGVGGCVGSMDLELRKKTFLKENLLNVRETRGKKKFLVDFAIINSR